MKVAVGIADVMCGMYAATGILAALRHRDATGEGQHIDLALIDSQIAWLINEGANHLLSGKTPIRRGNQHPNIVPYQVFAVADGHVIVAVGNDAQYARFCSIIGLPELADNPRYRTNPDRLRHRDELVAKIAAELPRFTKTELLSAMSDEGVPGGPINTLPEVFTSDQVAARQMRITMAHPAAASGEVDLIGNPLKLSKTPVSYRRAPPVCGADTEAVILDLLGQDALAEARASGCLE